MPRLRDELWNAPSKGKNAAKSPTKSECSSN
jgi:hypothetical protein